VWFGIRKFLEEEQHKRKRRTLFSLNLLIGKLFGRCFSGILKILQDASCSSVFGQTTLMQYLSCLKFGNLSINFLSRQSCKNIKDS
jgi:hypothetical protein